MRYNRLKQLLYVLIFLVLPVLSFARAKDEALLAKGNSLYKRAAYQQALDTYQKILTRDEASVVVYFNMGNAYFKLGDLPAALLYYEKAQRLAPNDEDIKANIRFVNARTVDKIEELPEFFLSRWWTSLLLSFPSGVLALASLLLMLTGSALLILYFFTHQVALKKASFYSAIVLFVLAVFTVFVASQQHSYQVKNRQAIVFASPVAIQSAPAANSRILFMVHEGTKVTLIESNPAWSRVKLANGNEGWMKTGDYKEIN
jgi:tetratricopeptide (TPR) repeat protein